MENTILIIQNIINQQVNKSNHHTIAKEDIDYAIGQAYSYKDFFIYIK